MAKKRSNRILLEGNGKTIEIEGCYEPGWICDENAFHQDRLLWWRGIKFLCLRRAKLLRLKAKYFLPKAHKVVYIENGVDCSHQERIRIVKRLLRDADWWQAQADKL